MFFGGLRCPRCQAPNPIQINRNTYRCGRCGYTWTGYGR